MGSLYGMGNFPNYIAVTGLLWYTEVNLKEGDNIFAFKVVNNLGASYKISKNIVFTPDPPEITIGNCPETSDKDTIVISGAVSDSNDDYPTLTVNGEPVKVEYSKWSATVALKEGDNAITLAAANSYGKTTTEVRHVKYTPPPKKAAP